MVSRCPLRKQAEDSRFFLTEDGEAGYAIHRNGELHGVFRNPQSTARGVGSEAALQAGHRGAYWLNVIDTGPMKRSTSRGFVEVARVLFSEQIARAGGMPEEVIAQTPAAPRTSSSGTTMGRRAPCGAKANRTRGRGSGGTWFISRRPMLRCAGTTSSSTLAP
jgi:hypothetical protein